MYAALQCVSCDCFVSLPPPQHLLHIDPVLAPFPPRQAMTRKIAHMPLSQHRNNTVLSGVHSLFLSVYFSPSLSLSLSLSSPLSLVLYARLALSPTLPSLLFLVVHTLGGQPCRRHANPEGARCAQSLCIGRWRWICSNDRDHRQRFSNDLQLGRGSKRLCSNRLCSFIAIKWRGGKPGEFWLWLLRPSSVFPGVCLLCMESFVSSYIAVFERRARLAQF